MITLLIVHYHLYLHHLFINPALTLLLLHHSMPIILHIVLHPHLLHLACILRSETHLPLHPPHHIHIHHLYPLHHLLIFQHLALIILLPHLLHPSILPLPLIIAILVLLRLPPLTYQPHRLHLHTHLHHHHITLHPLPNLTLNPLHPAHNITHPLTPHTRTPIQLMVIHLLHLPPTKGLGLDPVHHLTQTKQALILPLIQDHPLQSLLTIQRHPPTKRVTPNTNLLILLMIQLRRPHNPLTKEQTLKTILPPMPHKRAALSTIRPPIPHR